MKAGTLYYRLVAKKIEVHQRATQYLLLAGYSPKLTASKKDHAFLETLGPDSILTQEAIDRRLQALMKMSGTGQLENKTDAGTQKKLNKLFGVDEVPDPIVL